MLVKKTKNPESWSGMLWGKDLDQKGEMWKLIKGNLIKMDWGGQKGEYLTVNTHPNRKNQYRSPAGSNATSASRGKKIFLLSWQQLSQWETVTTQPLKSHHIWNSQFPPASFIFFFFEIFYLFISSKLYNCPSWLPCLFYKRIPSPLLGLPLWLSW